MRLTFIHKKIQSVYSVYTLQRIQIPEFEFKLFNLVSCSCSKGLETRKFSTYLDNEIIFVLVTLLSH